MYRQLTSSISSFLLNLISPLLEISIPLLVLPTLQISNTISAPATLASPHVCAYRVWAQKINGGASTSSRLPEKQFDTVPPFCFSRLLFLQSFFYLCLLYSLVLAPRMTHDS
ncbi:uncharacterized protein K444DRAFT_201284 [Hyaloscypha bicolor E]|uniref:Uncharacterized protein n=1 Tax=Hyaloscypha bicolor E TaxID=1095630 RepID=A0A2J6SQU1_9HELO|nr:uncharacterized protein K444DRAFT_201284 [Hyaloscypha bicolor E]PMD53142.1 hypothetical protein K444DRAFT_201284 [Hyaloscypha bicolor E]